jgi:hypothetical protein
MTGSIFEEILTLWDDQLSRRKRKILLLMDNFPGHYFVRLRYIRLEYLPANTTAVLQPMDQGVINCLEAYYRKFLVLKLIENIEKKIDRQITVLDAIILLHKSWEKVLSSTIANCFIHSGLA